MSPGSGTVKGRDLPERPFVGLDNYSEEYSELFFGRESEQQTLIGNLRVSQFTVLYAQSGVGKSSLLRAGVVSRLQALADQSHQEGRPRYVPAICSTWEGDALGQVAKSITEGVQRFLPEGAELEVPREGLDALIEAASESANATLLVILDQFEEYFAHQGEGSRTAFAAAIARCINRPDVRVNFLVSIRDDAYSRLGTLFKGHIPNVYGNYLHLAPLGLRGAEEAIRKPLEAFGVGIQDELVAAVLRGVTQKPGSNGEPARSESNGAGRGPYVAAPYLQLVMEKVWDEESDGDAPPRELHLEALGSGGTKRIIQRHVDEAMALLEGEHDEDVAAKALSYLAPSDRGKLTLTLGRLAQFTGYSEDELKPVLERLDGERIVATVADESYEIFHDVLAPYIVDWRTRHEEKRLEEVKREERDKRVKAEDEARRQAQLKRRARLLAGLAALVGVLAIGALVVVLVLVNQVEHQRTTSASRRLAGDALENPDLGLASLYALEAYRLSRTPDAQNAILALAGNHQLGAPFTTKAGSFTSVAFDSGGGRVAAGRDDNTIRVWDVNTRRKLKDLKGAKEAVNSVAFSPDGTLAAGASDGVIRLWDRAWHLLKFHPRRGPVFGVAFRRDGKALAAGYSSIPDPATGIAKQGSVQVWDPANPTRPPITLTGRTGPVASVAFRRGGKMLATSSCEPRLHQETTDHAVRLWDLTRRREVAVLKGHTAPVCRVAFSPDGKLLASASDDHTVLVWDVAHRRQVGNPLVGHTDVVTGVSFSPDGRTLASSSRDHTVRLWDVKRHLQVAAPLANHTSGVAAVAFSAAGTLATAGADSSVRLWGMRGPREQNAPIRGSSDAVLSIAFSPDGKKLAWIANDTTGHRVSIRDLANGSTRVVYAPTGSINGLAFSPDGSALAWAATETHSVQLWDLARPRPSGLFWGNSRETIKALAFSPDGRMVAFGDTDMDTGKGTIYLWDTTRRTWLGSLEGFKGETHGLAFSRDGTMLASGGDDGKVRLWDVAGRRQVKPPFSGHSGTVLGVAYNPDGRTLASGGSDQTVRLWSVRTHREVGPPLSRHLAAVYSVAFSSDGRTLASGSSDFNLRLWDVASRKSVPQPLSGHTGPVFGVAFSPDGETIASGAGDGTVRLWNNYSLKSAIAGLCGYIDKTKAERMWKLFEPDIEYRRPC